MNIITKPQLLQQHLNHLRSKKKTLGFVPTMGALHEGHLSLVRRARRENKIVVVSIFVNPTQFGPKEDFKKYPRSRSRDLKMLKKAKADIVFCPTAKSMYPGGYKTPVDPRVRKAVKKMIRVLCGKSRPTHVQVVIAVVSELFNLVGACRAYFGANDYQQAVIIKKMAAVLNPDIRVKTCPIVREKDGLALSSRNRYLSSPERRRAVKLSETPRWLKREIRSRRKGSLGAIKSQAKRRLKDSVSRVDYLDPVDPETLVSLKKRQPKMLAAGACFLGKTRLIDNVIIKL